MCASIDEASGWICTTVTSSPASLTYSLNAISRGSLHAPAKNEIPTGRPKQCPAGTVTCGYPATALSCAYALHRNANPALRDRYLTPIVDGRAIGAICVTEQNVGSDSAGMQTRIHFDPAQRTSLLYRKTMDGYELVGAMYTMPKRATEEQLNERVPLSVAMWHLHTNLCMPPKDQAKTADWTKFGLQGSISTQDACDAAGGNFHASVFGWMVHVYPYEDSLDRIFAMHHRD